MYRIVCISSFTRSFVDPAYQIQVTHDFGKLCRPVVPLTSVSSIYRSCPHKQAVASRYIN